MLLVLYGDVQFVGADEPRNASHEEVVAILDNAATAEHVTRLDFGRTVEDRKLAAVVVASPAMRSADDLRDDDLLVVLLLGGIHSGEAAGKEALLELVAELANDADHAWLEKLALVIAPNYNADGGARLGPDHRPGQNGPRLTGRRENAQDLDLNRDFIKLAAPETRALVQLIDDWNPHVFIDTHTTNGTHHRYRLTYDVPHHPAVAASIRSYLRDEFLPGVTHQLATVGVDAFYYGNLNDDHTQWRSFGYGGRYSTEYVGLRGRLAILSEAYAYDDFAGRIESSKRFVEACLDAAAADADGIRKLLRDVQRNTAAESINAEREIPLAAEPRAFDKPVVIRGFRTNDAGEKQPHDFVVEHVADYQPTKSIARPWGYFLPRECVRPVDRLLMHGVRVEQIEESTEVDVETSTIEKIERGDEFQGVRTVDLETSVAEERRELAPDGWIVRTAQPLGDLACVLLEAESGDGLATWGLFDEQLREEQAYPVRRILEPLESELRRVRSVEPTLTLDLEQIYGPDHRVNFGGRAVGQTWIAGTETYLRRRDARRYLVEPATGAERPFVAANSLRKALAKLPEIGEGDAEAVVGKAAWNGAADAALIHHAGDLFFYAATTDVALRLTHTPQVAERMPTLSPDGRYVAFIANHNLHVASTSDGRTWPLTSHGNERLLCGELDWVYQEELYGRGNFKGFWWNPAGDRLAFLEIDESPVLDYTLVDAAPYRGRVEVTPYPKSGDPLPRVRLGVVAVAGGPIRWVEHAEYTSFEHLLVRVAWDRTTGELLYQVQDRPQTWLDLRRAPASGGASKRILRETSPAWVEVLGNPLLLDDGSFLWLSDRGGARGLYKVSPDGEEVQALATGDWDVRTLHTVDEDEAWAYFSATKDSPIELHAYRTPLAGGEIERLTPLGANHAADFCESGRYFFDSASRPLEPPRVELRASDGNFIRTINPNLDDRLKYYRFGEMRYVQIPTDDGLTLNGRWVTPPDFDETKSHPVLIYTYGGPQAPSVWNRWGGATALWRQMLGQHGCCVLVVDPRASSSVGISRTYPIYGDMGAAELTDIEYAVTWLKQQPGVDAARIGITGWSYGGYMTAFALLHSKSFRAGASGAPVTDWRNYDAIYTERYMKLPQDNPEGYDRTRLADRAADLHGALLLIHGEIDDNVHPANTLQLAAALQRANQPFEMMIYPGGRHGVSQPRQARHLRELMTLFLERELEFGGDK